MDENIIVNELNPSEGTITVGTSATVILPDLTITGRRKSFTLTNTSSGGQTISFSIGGTPVAGNGIVLYPGGTWSESRDPAFEPTNKQITAIASASGGTVAYSERVDK